MQIAQYFWDKLSGKKFTFHELFLRNKWDSRTSRSFTKSQKL